MNARAAVGLAVAFILSAGTVALVGNALDSGDDESAGAEPVALLEPVNGSAPSAPSTSSTSGDGTDAGTGTTGGTSDGATDGRVATDASPSRLASVEPAGAGGTTRLGTTQVPWFTDPCAGASARPAVCTGVPGTVLGGFDNPQYQTAGFDIVSVLTYEYRGRAVASDSRTPGCGAGGGPNDLLLSIMSTNPAHFVATYDDFGRLPIEFDTSAAQRSQWERWDAAGEVGSQFGNLVQTCVLVPLVAPPAGERREIRIDGDDGATTDAATVTVTGPASVPTRPPVIFNPIDDNRVQVRVPMRYSRPRPTETTKNVFVTATYDTCTDLRHATPESFHSQHVRAESRSVLSDRQRNALPRLFDDWPNMYTAEVYRLASGEPVHVCIYWTSSRDDVTEQEDYFVAPPDRYRVRMAVVNASFRDVAVGADEVSIVGALPAGDGIAGCGTTLPRPTRAGSVAYAPPRNFCDTTEDGGLYSDAGNGSSLDNRLDLRVRGPLGTVGTRRIEVPRDPCHGRRCTPSMTRDYTLTIPGQTTYGMCGGMSACDPPASVESAGTVTIRVEFVAATGGGSDWQVGGAHPFGRTVTGSGAFASPTVLEYHWEPGNALVVSTSPPADVRAYIVDPPAPQRDLLATCALPGMTTSASGTSTTSGSPARLSFGSLCPGSFYFFGLEITSLDDGAAKAYYGVRPPGTVDGPVVGDYVVHATGAESVTISATYQITRLPDGYDTGPGVAAYPSITFGDNLPEHWPLPERCLVTLRSPRDLSFTNPMANEIPIEFVLDVRPGAPPVPPNTYCVADTNLGRATTTIRGTVTVSQLLMGPVRLTSPASDPLGAEVVLTSSLPPAET